MEDWKIHRNRDACTKPGCPLRYSPEYFAVLELPSCVRRDLCFECFRDVESRSERPPIFWKGRRRRDGKREVVLDLVALRMLFDRLGEEPGERPATLRYLVALLLLRKRVLKLTDPRTEAEEAADLLVVDPKLPEMGPVALHAPAIDTEQLVALKDELLAIAGKHESPETEPA